MPRGSLEDGAKVVVVRDSGWVGALATERLFIDGTEVAYLKDSERYEIYLKEGEHILGVLPKPLLKANAGDRKYLHEISVVVITGKTYFFRIILDVNQVNQIQRTSLFGQ